MTRLLLCAAEPSGDRLAAALLQRLRLVDPRVDARGIAGPAMRAAGVVPWVAAEGLTAIGLADGLRVAPAAWTALRRVRAEATRWRPDVVVTVDAPSLLLRIAGAARLAGWPTVHWVSPQLWAWRAGRAQAVAARVDTLLCLFAFERDFYAGTGLDARFTGHPAADRIAPMPARDPGGPPRFLLAPGSRPRELQRSWPVFGEVAAGLRRERPGCGLVVPVAPEVRGQLRGLDFEAAGPIEAVFADAALATTGTVTLELALRGIPLVAVAQTDALSWAIGRRVVQTPHLALPNVLAGARVVPEHHQRLQPEALVAALLRLAGPAGAAQREALRAGLATASGPDAVGRAAAAVWDRLQAGVRQPIS